MEAQPPQEELDPNKILEYEAALSTLALELNVLEGVITQEMIAVGGEMLASIYARYGDPASETYKEYHNDVHTLDVLKRSWMLLSLHKNKFPEKFTDHDYAIIMFTALGHDIVHGTGGPIGEDERQSAELTIEYMKRAGFTDEDYDRAKEVIMATAVHTNENGSIIQANIQAGNKDPLKLVFATADINGVAMEGSKTMVNNSFDLCLEIGKLSIKDLINEVFERAEAKSEESLSIVTFFRKQARFLEERLRLIRGDFEYYYTEKEAQAVNELYEQTFTNATRDAIGASEILRRYPNIADNLIQKALVDAALGSENAIEQLQIAKASLGKLFMRLPKEEVI